MRCAYKPAAVNNSEALSAPCGLPTKYKLDSFTFENKELEILL